jgi:pilus assembly protein CpaB
MNAKTWMPLGLAVALGLTAAFVAQRSMHNKNSQTAQKMVQIAVAKAPIAPGAMLGPDDITLTPMPGEAPPPQTFTNPGDLIGRVISAPMVPGQAFVTTLLAPKGTLAGLEALVPQGMRAVTVDVTESGAMSGLLTPGARVDVVVTNINREDQSKSVTRTIVQNLTVAAVGQRLSPAKSDGEKEMPVARTVTLLVTPHNAQMLDMAQSIGRIRLIMRATGDQAKDVVDNVMFTELLGGDENVFAPTPTPNPVVPVVAPATQSSVQQATFPTTRPATQTASPAQPPTRVVTLINGSEEHHLTFEEPLPIRPTDYTDVSKDRDNVIPN